MQKNKRIFLMTIIVIMVLVSVFLLNLKSYAQAGDDFSASDFKFSEKCLDVNFHKNSNKFEVRSMEVNTWKCAYLDNYNLWKGKSFNGIVASPKNKVLGYFGVDNNLSISICSDSIDDVGNMSGGCIEQSEGELTVQLPYFPNGKYADIFDPSGKKVLTIDLSSKATCNENDQCDRPVEDSENCPEDCKKGEPKIDPAVVQLATVNQQKEIQQAEDGKISLADLGWWGIAILIILLAGGGIGYWVYRRNRDSEQ